MQETLHQRADVGVSLSDSRCRSISIRQRMQETLYQTAGARDSIRQPMQETIYQTADAGDSLSECLIERLLHLLSDTESHASSV